MPQEGIRIFRTRSRAEAGPGPFVSQEFSLLAGAALLELLDLSSPFGLRLGRRSTAHASSFAAATPGASVRRRSRKVLQPLQEIRCFPDAVERYFHMAGRASRGHHDASCSESSSPLLIELLDGRSVEPRPPLPTLNLPSMPRVARPPSTAARLRLRAGCRSAGRLPEAKYDTQIQLRRCTLQGDVQRGWIRNATLALNPTTGDESRKGSVMLKSRLVGAVGIVAIVGGALMAQTPASRPKIRGRIYQSQSNGSTRSIPD